MSDTARGRGVLRGILGFTIVSTALHYTHNYVEIDQYPEADLVSNDTVQVAILVSWPLLTAVGLLAYGLYARGRLAGARAGLLAYSVLGFATMGHFLEESPDIPAFWYATIFTDLLGALAVVAFVVWSAARGPTPAGVGT